MTFITAVLAPFNSVQTCPACGLPTKDFTVEFSTDTKIEAGNGRFVSIQTYGDPLVPHLEKHCPHCDFGWLEHTAAGMATSTA